MKKYFLKRTLSGIFSIFVILTANFFLIAYMKGDAASIGIIELEVKKRMRQEFGLNNSAFEQFIVWIKKLLKGDLGNSYGMIPRKVNFQVNDMFVKTIQVLIPAIIVATIITIITCAILHARRRSSITQFVTKIFCYIGVSLPSFIIAMLCIKLYTGEGVIQEFIGKSAYNAIVTGKEFPFYELRRWAMPFTAITIVAIAMLFKYLDTLMNEVMSSEFIKMARAKGLKEKTIMYRHAIRYAACPFITAISLTLIGLMGSQFIIEIVTKWNGLGSGLYSAISYRDYPLIMGILLYMTIITVAINIVVDCFYSLLDPRIRVEG